MKKIIILIVLTFAINSSHNCIAQTQKKVNVNPTEDFKTFCKKFFSDSLFQSKRINWPLKGGMMVSYQFEQTWKKNDFEFIAKKGPTISKRINYKEYELMEDIGKCLENSGRHFIFKLINNHWKLVEYVEFYN